MSGPVYWCCLNHECRRLNEVDSSYLEQAVMLDKIPIVVCGTCGYVYNFMHVKTKKERFWLECLPFMGREKRLPTGRGDAGQYIDFENKSVQRNDFILTYGVDPEIYLNWRDQNKPKYKNLCTEP